MKNYEDMTLRELVHIVRVQDRIISSLLREMSRCKPKRKEDKPYKTREEKSKTISIARMTKISPERRKEIGRIAGEAAAAKRRQEKQLELARVETNGHP